MKAGNRKRDFAKEVDQFEARRADDRAAIIQYMFAIKKILDKSGCQGIRDSLAISMGDRVYTCNISWGSPCGNDNIVFLSQPLDKADLGMWKIKDMKPQGASDKESADSDPITLTINEEDDSND